MREQKLNIKTNKGITLVALIITIIILLILTTVTIKTLTDSGIIGRAQNATEQYTVAQEKELISLGYVNYQMEKMREEDATLTVEGATVSGDEEAGWTITFDKTGNQYGLKDGNVTPIKESNSINISKGAFVEYNVEYTDAYKGYEYTSKNGWRLLDYTDNGDGTLSNVKLISTGIPAKLYYYYNDTTNSNWYVTDAAKLADFRELLGGEDYTFYTGANTYYALQASAGMYYNFGDIKFAYGTENRGKSLGYFTKIKTNETTYDVSNTAETTGANLFIPEGTNATVRLLTLPELNKAVGRIDIDSTSTISTTEDEIGLYRLDQLKNVMTENTYDTGWYWLASPGPNRSNGSNVCLVYYGGNVTATVSNNYGVRPVVCLSSNVKIEDKNSDDILEIIQLDS